MASRTEKRIESLDTHINNLAERFKDSKEYISKVSPEKDYRIVKYFPEFLLVALLVWATFMLIRGNYSFAGFITYLCVAFLICFAIAGVVCFIIMDHGPFPRRFLLLTSLVLSAVIMLTGFATDNSIFVDAVYDAVDLFGWNLTEVEVGITAFLFIFGMITFTSTGVLTVISAYLRVYLVKVFVSMDKHILKNKRGKAESFFMVPDIIDVKSIQMDPKIDYKKFDTLSAVNLGVYIMIMINLFSCFLYLNPYFLDTMTTKEMLSIMLMLSMFVPAIIIPWQLVRDMRVHVKSDAPRDYYLWVGAKRRLFSAFLTLTAFGMLFLLSIYYGNDPLEIISIYIIMLIPLACISIFYSLVYTNNFLNGTMVSIYTRFMDGKVKNRAAPSIDNQDAGISENEE